MTLIAWVTPKCSRGCLLLVPPDPLRSNLEILSSSYVDSYLPPPDRVFVFPLRSLVQMIEELLLLLLPSSSTAAGLKPAGSSQQRICTPVILGHVSEKTSARARLRRLMSCIPREAGPPLGGGDLCSRVPVSSSSSGGGSQTPTPRRRRSFRRQASYEQALASTGPLHWALPVDAKRIAPHPFYFMNRKEYDDNVSIEYIQGNPTPSLLFDEIVRKNSQLPSASIARQPRALRTSGLQTHNQSSLLHSHRQP